MIKQQREKFINLVFSGGDVDLAYLLDSTYSIKEYETALDKPEYEVFNKEISKRFIENSDQRILGNLYRAEVALKDIGPEHRNYPAILRTYKELLQLTSPIIEKLQKVKVESTMFDGLELAIKGVGIG